MNPVRLGNHYAVPIVSSGFGFATVVFKDDLGSLFIVYKNIIATIDYYGPLDTLFYAYINSSSVSHSKWTKIGKREIPEESSLPPRFNGHPKFFWEVTFNGKKERVDAATTSYESLLKKGYIPRTLWLASSIEAAICNQQAPRWKW